MNKTHSPNWAFRMMSIIHDHPLRRKITDPYKLLTTAELKIGDKTLEIGPGPGFYTIPAAKIVTNTGIVYAIDIHPLSIKKIKLKAKKSNIENIIPILSDATNSGLESNSLDHAFLFGVPRIIRNKKTFFLLLEEIYRVLKKDGIIAIKTSKNILNILKEAGFSFYKQKKGIVLYKKN